jgi:hypothetical protein
VGSNFNFDIFFEILDLFEPDLEVLPKIRSAVFKKPIISGEKAEIEKTGSATENIFLCQFRTISSVTFKIQKKQGFINVEVIQKQISNFIISFRHNTL